MDANNEDAAPEGGGEEEGQVMKDSPPPSSGGEGGDDTKGTLGKNDKKAGEKQWEATRKDWKKEGVQKDELLKEEVQTE